MHAPSMILPCASQQPATATPCQPWWQQPQTRGVCLTAAALSTCSSDTLLSTPDTSCIMSRYPHSPVRKSDRSGAYYIGSMAPALSDKLQDGMCPGRFPLDLHRHDAKQQDLRHAKAQEGGDASSTHTLDMRRTPVTHARCPSTCQQRWTMLECFCRDTPIFGRIVPCGKHEGQFA